MENKVYINAAQSISPQDTFQATSIPERLRESDSLPLKCLLPDFKKHFNPLESRRITKLTKSNHICALSALEQSDVQCPDAIITASGLGSVGSTEKFLNDLLKTNEGLLAPTSFIQSINNAIGGQIAIHLGCKGYNMLHSQKSFSFENALIDASLKLKNNGLNSILVGAFDEITNESYYLKQKISLYKKEIEDPKMLISSVTKGTVAGEGISYFVVSNKLNDNNLAELKGAYTSLYFDNKEPTNWISNCIEESGLTLNNIDLIIIGADGDVENNSIYNGIVKENFPDSTIALYKNMTGHYDTASAFATWFGVMALLTNQVPEYSILTKREKRIEHVAIYHQQKNMYHSLILLSKIVRTSP